MTSDEFFQRYRAMSGDDRARFLAAMRIVSAAIWSDTALTIAAMLDPELDRRRRLHRAVVDADWAKAKVELDQRISHPLALFGGDR